MDVVEAIKTRRSVRAWTNQDIPDDILRQILEAGRWSPSPLNSQPWHFIVIREKSTIENLSLHAQEGSFLRFANVCIVITVDKQNPSENNPHISLIKWLEEHDQYAYSAGCSIQNMWLTAWSLGIGGTWVTVDAPTACPFLEIPEDQTIIGSLALGYPLGNPVPHKDQDRKPLPDFIFHEKYGK